jgi:hypothetical protein
MGKRHLSGLVGFAFVSLLAGAAHAAPEDSCTTGDVEALLQNLPVPNQVMRPRGQDHPGLLDALADCQYRLFRDGETFVFSADLPFLGGVVWVSDYVNLGITHQEAIADLKLHVDQVWLAEVLPGRFRRVSIPASGRTYRVPVAIPEGAASQQFNVTTSLR